MNLDDDESFRRKVVDKNDGKSESTRKHLKVRTVVHPKVHPLQNIDIDGNRNVHSSPIKGYRCLGDQENDDKEQVRSLLCRDRT